MFTKFTAKENRLREASYRHLHRADMGYKLKTSEEYEDGCLVGCSAV
jgi:hypothetical protein